MTSLSNVIKPHHYVALTNKKRIKVHRPDSVLHHEKLQEAHPLTEVASQQSKCLVAQAEAEQEHERMMTQAEQQAKEIHQQALEEIERMKKQAKQEINHWWEQRRQDDEQQIAIAQEKGKQLGLQAGRAEAEAEVKAVYADKLSLAQRIIEQAYEAKDDIIQEAEPFLLELSVELAQKIISKQLTVEPSWIIDSIKNVLNRRKKQGAVTLCVSPQQFEWVNEAKEELRLVLDSETDLHIVPDFRVQDAGCIVRSAYGSMDARIDTQLTEIKRALLEVASSPEETKQ